MGSRVVKSELLWKCPDCLERETRSPDFRARELAVTQVLDDGTRITATLWHRAGGPRTPGEHFTRALHALTNPNVRVIGRISGSFADTRRSLEQPRTFATVLEPGEEVEIRCGRKHGGHRLADGSWVEGEPGSIIVSDARFVQALQAITAG